MIQIVDIGFESSSSSDTVLIAHIHFSESIEPVPETLMIFAEKIRLAIEDMLNKRDGQNVWESHSNWDIYRKVEQAEKEWWHLSFDGVSNDKTWRILVVFQE